MRAAEQHRPNPLQRAALGTPAPLGRTLAGGATAAGAALAFVIAAGESYQRTRVLSLAIGVLALAALLPLRRGALQRLPWVGAGLLFFAGALLAHLAAGKGLLAAGAIAALGAALDDQHCARASGVPAFFMGFGLTSVLVVAIILGISG